MSIGLIVNGFKRIFSGQDAFAKHLSLFAITGFYSLGTVYLQDLSEQMKNAAVVPNLQLPIMALVLLFIVGIYMCGYLIRFWHNSYDDNNPSILPDIDGKAFGTFFKALPLYIVWFLWIVIVQILGLIPIVGWIGLIILLFIWIPFIQFVFVAYAKYFNAKGLYKISLPIGYAKKSFGSVVILGLLFIPVWIVAMLPAFVIGFVFGLLGGTDTTFIMYVGGLLTGYLGFLIQLCWSYCIVQIYREKIEPDLD